MTRRGTPYGRGPRYPVRVFDGDRLVAMVMPLRPADGGRA